MVDRGALGANSVSGLSQFAFFGDESGEFGVPLAAFEATRPATETMPSLAPTTPARSQFSREPRVSTVIGSGFTRAGRWDRSRPPAATSQVRVPGPARLPVPNRPVYRCPHSEIIASRSVT